MKQNYDLIMQDIINKNCFDKKPSLLLHICCAPCSSATLERLYEYFKITILFYNPNIAPKVEFDRRYEELKRFVKEKKYEVDFIETEYNENEFQQIAKGLEKEPEGGERCFKCYRLRLERTAEIAKNIGATFFTTSLSISPHKNSEKLNEIGSELENKYNIKYLFSDFKKREGYKRSIELSREFNLYRQDYCGCIYSRVQKNKK